MTEKTYHVVKVAGAARKVRTYEVLHCAECGAERAGYGELAAHAKVTGHKAK